MADREYIDVVPEDAESLPVTKDIVVEYMPSAITDNIAAVERYVEAQIEPFQGAEIDPADAEQVKTARKAMAELNKLKKPIEDERKRIKREYMKPLDAFEARVKAITAKIDGARAGLKQQVDAADAAFKAQRRAALEAEYAACAGPIADVIAFDALCEGEWLTRSMPEQRALAKLGDKAAAALEGYNALRNRMLMHPDEVVKRYCETLDLQQALTLEDELVERDRQMAEFKEAQERAEAERRARMEAYGGNPNPVQTVFAGPEDYIDDYADDGWEPGPAPEPEPAPEPRYVWSLKIDDEFTATREMAEHIGLQLKAVGITGFTIKCMRRDGDD